MDKHWLEQSSSTWGNTGVRKGILGITWKHLTGFVKFKENRLLFRHKHFILDVDYRLFEIWIVHQQLSR
jgi:hypothetical protein